MSFVLLLLLSSCIVSAVDCDYTLNGVAKTFAHGATAYKECDTNHDGFKVLTCNNGAVSESTEKCTTQPITLFGYGVESLTIYKGIAMTTLAALKDPRLTTFSVSPALPAGITLSATTGDISGTTTAGAQTNIVYTINATNADSIMLTTTMKISIVVIMCPASDGFAATEAGTIGSSTTACPAGFSGTAKLSCSANGQWTGQLDTASCSLQPLQSFGYGTSINSKRLETIPSISPSYTALPPTITVSFAIASGTLPAGLTLNTATGTITGIATEKKSATSISIRATTKYNAVTADTTATISVTITDASCTGMQDQNGSSVTVTHNNELVSTCPAGYTGSSGYKCLDGVYQPLDTSKCIPSKPEEFSYPRERYDWILGDTVSTGLPFFKNPVTKFEVNPALPSGLQLNTTSGEIFGIPDGVKAATQYAVKAINSINSATVTLTISTANPVCEPTTDITRTGQISMENKYDCTDYRKDDDTLKLKFTGESVRKCVMNENNRAQWQIPESFCIQDTDYTLLIIAISLVVVGVIICLISCCIRTGQKKTLSSGNSGTSKATKGAPAKAPKKAAVKV